MGKSGKEVRGVRAVARAEVGRRDSNTGVHHRQCAGAVGWAGARGEGEGEGEGSRNGCGGDGDRGDGRGRGGRGVGETGAGAEKDRDGEMEVEETLKEAEKLADEVVMEE